MSGALERLRQDVAQALNRGGVAAVAAMEPQGRKRWDTPVAAVGLAGLSCRPGGFQDYLGTGKNPDTGAQEERYGRGAELTLSLDLYAPRDAGEGACQQALARMSEVLLTGGAGGLEVAEIAAERVEFLHQDGLYRLPVRCRCAAWLIVRRDSAGAFTDFEVKGRLV